MTIITLFLFDMLPVKGRVPPSYYSQIARLKYFIGRFFIKNICSFSENSIEA